MWRTFKSFQGTRISQQGNHGWGSFPSSRATTVSPTGLWKKYTLIAVLVTDCGYPSRGGGGVSHCFITPAFIPAGESLHCNHPIVSCVRLGTRCMEGVADHPDLLTDFLPIPTLPNNPVRVQNNPCNKTGYVNETMPSPVQKKAVRCRTYLPHPS